jgi:hypothetical protein
MVNFLLPRTADNTYRGHKLGLWIFAVVVLLKIGIALGSLFNGPNAAAQADGIPLNTFGATGARDFLSLDAGLSVTLLMMAVIAVIVLLRYRALVPLMFTILLAEQLLRRLAYQVVPMIRVGTPPGIWINLVLVVLMVVGLALSLAPVAPKGSSGRVTP